MPHGDDSCSSPWGILGGDKIVRQYFCIIPIFVRSFTRRAVWMILLSLGVAGTLSYYWLASGDEPRFALHMTTFFQALLTFVFAIMGIEWLVTSSLNTGLLRYVQTMGVDSSGFLMNFLNMGIINYHVLTNAVTKMPIELPRWVARAGILTIMAGLFVSDGSRQFASTHSQKKRKQLAFTLVVVCAIAFMVFCHQRYAIFFTRFADPEDITMYALAKSKAYVPGESVSLADYPTEKT